MSRSAIALLLGLAACSDPPPPEAPDGPDPDALEGGKGRVQKPEVGPARAIYGPPPTVDDRGLKPKIIRPDPDEAEPDADEPDAEPEVVPATDADKKKKQPEDPE